ncbi:disease resistance protein RPM1-like [Ricinus communis]|uniref:disease resistance protein RPM1-like n=1 Tax=Ricinus communis TaxID=3988 RepID=UPI00201A8928|nr:disease resistance protein RPM1-like [Ricinus communis]
MELMTDFQLVDAIRTLLHQKRYIIVFDDVLSVDAWDAIMYAFPDCNSGSRIIFTTRSSNVAASLEITNRVYHLQPLTQSEAWTLFCRKAFRAEHKGVCPVELEELSRGILRRCEGLPLAIVAIGGMLSKKIKVGSEWRKVHDSLAAEFRNDNNLGSLQRILLLSYNDLPHYLKLCYLYLSVFPEDYLIRRTNLVRLWVVERIVKEKQGLTMEEAAEDYFNELVSRSMIQVVEVDFSYRVKTCRLHDLMREIIQLKSKEESFVVIANEGGIRTNDKVHRLSIHDNPKELSSGIRFPYLRSLLLFTPTDSVACFGHALFRDFKLLRVLELENLPLLSFPPELIGLIHLRYLSLRRTMITVLPESIRKLKNLEILDLKRSLVSSLPYGILELKNLRQLRNYRYRSGSSMFSQTYTE